MNRFLLFIVSLLFCSAVMASERYINIVTPTGDLVIDSTVAVLVSGTGKGLFEGNVVVRFEDLEGNLLIQESATMQRQNIAAAEKWQFSISLPQPVPKSIRLIAFSPSPKEGESALTRVPVMLDVSGATGGLLTNSRWKLNEYLNESGELQTIIAFYSFTCRI